MRDTLEAFYFGNLNPTEKSMHNNSRYRKLSKRASEAYDDVARILDDVQRAAFDNYVSLQLSVQAESELESFILGYLAFDKDKIQRPTAEELEQLFGDFAKICQACKSEKFMNFIGGLLPQKKNGSLHIGRKTVLAKLPLLIGLLNDADMRLSHSFDLVAKIESETEVSLWVEWVDLVKSVEEDYHSFLRSEAVLPFDEMLKIASQYV